MFVVYAGCFLTTGLFLQALTGRGEAAPGFILAVALWLWFTVLFANFAEAMAEGRGKAQAADLRKARNDDDRRSGSPQPRRDAARRSPRVDRRCDRATTCSSRRAT